MAGKRPWASVKLGPAAVQGKASIPRAHPRTVFAQVDVATVFAVPIGRVGQWDGKVWQKASV